MKRFMLAVPLGIIAAMTLASAAAINVTGGAGSVGAGDGAVTGYTVTNVQWVLDEGNITGVSFNITGTPDSVDVATNGVKAGGSDPDGYDNWVCPLPIGGLAECTAGAGVSPWSVFQLLVTAAN